MTTLTETLDEFADAFETGKRDDGSKFVRLKDDCAGWIDVDLMRGIHEALDDRSPSDWVYETAEAFACCLQGYGPYETLANMRENVHEIADGLVDIYNAERMNWLADHLNNAALVDKACEEFGSNGRDTFERIGLGQYMAIERIGHAVIAALESEAESRDA